MNKRNTSWEESSQWYHNLVGKEGHYYHKQVIFPHILKLLKTKKTDLSMLDLGCGQGVFALTLPKEFSYDGVDLSPSLITLAKKHASLPHRSFHHHDVCEPFDLGKTFTHVAMILSLQNLANPKGALTNAKKHLKQGGTLLIVLNHPCFRIPRHSSWHVDESHKVQYRRIDSYLTPQSIPIDMHPGEPTSASTLSFHYPLSLIFSFLQECGFTVSNLTELCSDKVSIGKYAKIENRARNEIPLFLTLVAKSL
jgi:SAM-dependent methyltransferase